VVEVFSPGHLIPLLIVAALVFFGWKQLPDMARSAGKSLRVFRTEVKGLTDDDATRATRSALDVSASDLPAAAPMATPVPTMPVVDAMPAAPAAPAMSAPPAPSPVSQPEEVTAPDTSGKPAG
jgi:sec-independent protein translocase protein TatA